MDSVGRRCGFGPTGLLGGGWSPVSSRPDRPRKRERENRNEAGEEKDTHDCPCGDQVTLVEDVDQSLRGQPRSTYTCLRRSSGTHLVALLFPQVLNDGLAARAERVSCIEHVNNHIRTVKHCLCQRPFVGEVICWCTGDASPPRRFLPPRIEMRFSSACSLLTFVELAPNTTRSTLLVDGSGNE